MGDLSSAMDTAFDEVKGSSAPASTSSEPEPVESAPEARETTSDAAEPAEEAAKPVSEAKDDEPTGDVLLDRLTPEQIAHLKTSPEGRAVYRGLMQSYTQKMQRFSEQEKLWDALNNPQSQRQAIEALARSVGLQIQPTDLPQREKAAEVADSMSDKWTNVVGAEAAKLLRPLIEETARLAVQGQIQPLQAVAQQVEQEALGRQAEAQLSEFRAKASKQGWEITPEVEAKMVEIGREIAPTRLNPLTGRLEPTLFETTEQGVRWLEKCWRLATADGQEAAIERRILERMAKAAQTAEPGRGVPSTGREKRTNITKEMNLNEAMDVAFSELGLNR